MYLICNHKNKLSYNEVKEYKKSLDKLDNKSIDLIIAPSLPFIYDFIEYRLASQDITSKKESLTGEISGKQLNSLFVEYVLIGHAERREYFSEDLDILISKIKNAHENDIKVIYIFTSFEKSFNNTLELIEKEYERLKDYLKESDLIAFEPQWAIGDKQLDYALINEVVNKLNKLSNKKIIYGGSVNDNTVDELLKIDNINGFLVSTISTDVLKLEKIINKMT